MELVLTGTHTRAFALGAAGSTMAPTGRRAAIPVFSAMTVKDWTIEDIALFDVGSIERAWRMWSCTGLEHNRGESQRLDRPSSCSSFLGQVKGGGYEHAEAPIWREDDALTLEPATSCIKAGRGGWRDHSATASRSHVSTTTG